MGHARRAVAVAATVLLGLSAGASQEMGSRSWAGPRTDPSDGRAFCAAMPSTSVTALPRLHGEAAPDGDDRTGDDPALRSFVHQATTYRGDPAVGRATWWTGPLDASDFLVPIDAAHAAFAGAARDPGTDRPARERVVGVLGPAGAAGSWARRMGSTVAAADGADIAPAVLAGDMLVVGTARHVGGLVYASVVCAVDARTGRTRWGATAMVSGPVPPMDLVVTARAIVVVLDDRLVVALDRRSGRTLWKRDLGAPASVKAAGGRVVVGPKPWADPTGGPTRFRQVQALDPQDGHVAWAVPVPPWTDTELHDWQVLASADGQPVVVDQTDQRLKPWPYPEPKGAAPGWFPERRRLVAYGPAGSVRWQLPAAVPEAAFTQGEQLFTSEPATRDGAGVLTARSLRDGGVAWTVRADASDAVFTGERMFLLDAGPHGRSLLVDRRTGAATPVLADCLGCVPGKMGITTSAALSGDTLFVSGSDGSSRRVVSYPLSGRRS